MRVYSLLIRRFIKAGYVEANMYHEVEKGTPQGGNLSPILSNIFLHYVLDLWFEKKIKKELKGNCHLVRYADDYICMVQYKEQAAYLEHALKERFKKFELELHTDKTRTISFGRYERENAKRSKRKANTFEFLGFTHYCGMSRKGKFIVGRKTNRKKLAKKCKEMNQWLKSVRNAEQIKNWWPILKSKLRGHYQYYGISGNIREISSYYTISVRLTCKWLNRRSQKKSYNRDSFKRYLEHYQLPEPKIIHNIYTLSPVS